jgi:hypothetical protein
MLEGVILVFSKAKGYTNVLNASTDAPYVILTLTNAYIVGITSTLRTNYAILAQATA